MDTTRSDTDWTTRVQDLCTRLRLSRKQLGKIVYGYEDDGSARKAGSRLATKDKEWSGPVRLTIERLEDGTLDPNEELRRFEDHADHP